MIRFKARALRAESFSLATTPAATSSKFPSSCACASFQEASMSHDKSETTSVSKTEFDRLMEMMSGLQKQMSSMKRELSDEREASNERLVKRIKLDKAPVFKKKSNEKQFHFNEEVREKLSAASASLATAPLSIEKAKEALKEGEALISARQKVIRIADRSEFGWATVEEYEEDELADNSDDEKRLYRAKLHAGRRIKAAAAKNKKKKDGFRKEWRPRPQSLDSQSPPSSHVQQSSSSTSIAAARTIPTVQGLGPCFLCGKMGRFRRTCPLLQSNIPGSK